MARQELDTRLSATMNGVMTSIFGKPRGRLKASVAEALTFMFLEMSYPEQLCS